VRQVNLGGADSQPNAAYFWLDTVDSSLSSPATPRKLGCEGGNIGSRRSGKDSRMIASSVAPMDSGGISIRSA
jgi:hypothetical protein